VAENLRDSLAVIDLATRQVIQRYAAGSYPSGVAVNSAKVYVSAWHGSSLTTFLEQSGGLTAGPNIEVGRHPSTMLLDVTRQRLYVTCASSNRIAVIDAKRDLPLVVLNDPAPGAPAEGSTPDGLTLSPDGRRLYVAEADNNAVAVFSLSASTSGVPEATGADSLIGRIPVEWYPTAVLARGGSLWALNGKGRGTAPNPGRGPSDRKTREPRQHTLGQLDGSLSALAAVNDRALATFSQRVAHANGWDRPRDSGHLPPFRHVIYLIRENRTFDQVLGDLPGADGDDSLTYFPREVTPNAHALAERFGIWDRFFVNAEVSGDGHNWTSAAYATDYIEKTIPSEYSGRGRTYDYEGENRDTLTDDDAAEPTNGYLWDLARRAGVSLGTTVSSRARCRIACGSASAVALRAHGSSISGIPCPTPSGRRAGSRSSAADRGRLHAGADHPAPAERSHGRRQGRRPHPAGIRRRERPRARSPGRGGHTLPLLEEHRPVRARGRRPGRAGSRGFASLAALGDLALQPPRRHPSYRQHHRRDRHHRSRARPRSLVALRLLR
jgi:sugar lactone lactonase YvrE